MTYSWQFNKMRPCDKAREPIESEFFAAEAISDPGEALVREGIQNSLDARRNGEKVLVRVRVSGTKGAAQRDKVVPFLHGLDEHLRAPGNGLREVPGDKEACPFLVFEDFGTTGLLGNPGEWRPVAGARNHFYLFFRAEGRSDKSEKDLGRWGVGKQVFLRASRINSIFGLTVRCDDKRTMLMGMSVLKSHDVHGTRYAPDGWFGQLKRDKDDSMVMPIEDREFITHFAEVFDIERGNDPGLSIIIPWYDPDLTDENLVRAVLRYYFWPILKGQLEVIVETGTIQTILDAPSLDREIRKIGGDLEKEMLPLIELARWSGGLSDRDFILLKKPDPGGAWQWSRDLFSEESLTTIRSRYENGDKIAIRVPVDVREKKKRPCSSYFDIFLVRDGTEQSGRPVFIREGIIIPDVRAPWTRGVRSICNAEDGPIAGFLGDSENPAHTQWQKDGSNFKGKYVSGVTDLQFVIRAVHQVVSIICEEDRTEDPTLLLDLFSIPEPSGGPKVPSPTGTEDEGGGPEAPGGPNRPTSRSPFVIDRINGGFVVRYNADDKPPPEGLLVRMAYQIRRGNPFKKYRAADFDLSGGMNVRTEGATVLEKNRNRLRVAINEKNFRIEVTGFDPKRDVRVEVRQERGDHADSND